MSNNIQMNRNRILVLSGLVLGVAMMRLISLPLPNFAPIGAMALFGAAYFKNKSMGFLVPLSAMLITDGILELTTGWGFHSGMLFVYGSFFLMGMIGLKLRDNISIKTVGLGAIGASVLFFLVTNFGAWLGSPIYPQSLGGLLSAYAAGLAFFKGEAFGSPVLNTVLGNLFYSGVLFGAFELAKSKMPQLAVK